jgi:hypothetical protein
MVWDRVRRGPALIGDRKLVRLSRDAAEAALAELLAVKSESKRPTASTRGKWQVVYGHNVIDCRDEHEAKIVVRRLIGKRLKVVARMSSGERVLRTIEGPDLRAWLSK